MSHVLQVVDGCPDYERQFDLVEDRLLIGRHSGECTRRHLTADIVLQNLTVGRNHAVLTRSEDGYVVEDLDSRPGTLVNGIQIKQPVRLDNGDIVHIGSVKLKYRCETKGQGELMNNKIVQGNNEFALDLYGHLARAGKKNLFFSPYSISSALAMVFAGACRQTEQEMASVLRFPAEQDDLHPIFEKLNETIFGGQKSDYIIKIANRLWGQKGYRFGAKYLELLRTNYGADLEQLDFGE